MLLRSVPVAVALAMLAAAPAHAQGLMFNSPLKPCYVAAQEEETEPIAIDAFGFTPTALVDFYVDEIPQGVRDKDGNEVRATYDGRLRGMLSAPFVEEGERMFSLRITERDSQRHLQAASRVTRLMVEQRPAQARTRERVRFRGRGFTDLTKPVYAHYVFAGKSRKTVRLEMPTRDCGLFSVKRRQFPFKKSPRRGVWTIQFDQSRDYDANAAVRFTLSVRVRKAIKPERAQAR